MKAAAGSKSNQIATMALRNQLSDDHDGDSTQDREEVNDRLFHESQAQFQPLEATSDDSDIESGNSSHLITNKSHRRISIQQLKI